MKILIANRGEIARRIIRTAHRLGHKTVAVYAEPDAGAPFVREAGEAVAIGPAALAESYLSAVKILDAAAATEATAIHPGYGFLSENAAFARAVVDAGLIWIGPRAEAIEQMGSKIEARKLAASAGVPTIPGFDDSQDHDELKAAAASIGYPVLIKASAGGGGKGIRVAHHPDEFDHALSEASTEAERSFGDGRVIVERFITQPRHIEVQVIGDLHGRLAELGTRECSVQRRYQKVLEEAPAPNLPGATRSGLRSSALLLGESIDYDSAGTVEFIVDDATGEHFFLEMNTRLQVEHPVTEYVTGLDLVELMIQSAAGEPLDLPHEIAITGHAIEARINAEDPADDFSPQTGTVHELRVPPDVRWDSAVESGGEISPFYDSMIAKLIVGAASRDQAIAAMRTALDSLIIGGLKTNTGLQRWLLDTKEFVDGRITTRFLDDRPFTPAVEPEAASRSAAIAWLRSQQQAPGSAASPWTARGSHSMTPYVAISTICVRSIVDDELYEHALTGADTSSADPVPIHVDRTASRVALNLHGETFAFDVVPRSEGWSADKSDRAGAGDAIVAPFPAVVTDVHVAPGDGVAGDQVLVVIEAMKMLHSLRTTGAATVDEVRVAVGDQVTSKQVLITFLPSDPA